MAAMATFVNLFIAASDDAAAEAAAEFARHSRYNVISELRATGWVVVRVSFSPWKKRREFHFCARDRVESILREQRLCPATFGTALDGAPLARWAADDAFCREIVNTFANRRG